MITIKKVDNGLIVEDSDASGSEPDITVYEFDQDKEEGEIEAAQHLFYDLLYMLGINNSKHNKKVLDIDIKDNEG